MTGNGRIMRVGRAIESRVNHSRQPRFRDSRRMFNTIVNWIRLADLEEPAYSTDSRKRDKFLSTFWKREPHLAGVVHAVVSIDKNRGWSLVGGRNQVMAFQQVLKNYDGEGWRYGLSRSAQSFYTTDLGAVIEIGRDGENGPMRGLYHVDSTRCKLTGNINYPLTYYPAQEKEIDFRPQDYFRVTSMPSTDETHYGLGLCAISRALEFAKLMVGVYMHDQEQLGARAPRGLMLLQNISEEQWQQALEMREAELSAIGRKYFNGVMVLASEGVDQVDAKLIALSQLPAGFDMQKTVDLIMFGYALVFGYDPAEFWPVQASVIGRTKESDSQERKATGKGGQNFILDLQEKIQSELPSTLFFEFDQRDSAAELADATLKAQYIELTSLAYEKGLLDREEARSMLADFGVIDRDWTILQEDEMVTDRTLVQRLMGQERIVRALERYPQEPIVRFHYTPATGKTQMQVLSWPGEKHRSFWIK